MNIWNWINLLLLVLGLYYAYFVKNNGDQPMRAEHYIIIAIFIGGAIWAALDFLKLKKESLGKDKFRGYVSAKKDSLIYILLGILIGYFWWYERERPPYEVWLENSKNIEVVQKPRGDVYTFAPSGDGNYHLVSTGTQRNKGK